MEKLNDLIDLIKKGEETKSVKEVEKLLKSLSPKEIIMNGITPAMRELGELFDRKEIFIPTLLLAADAVFEIMDILEPYLLEEEDEEEKKKILIGTVEGDIHEIGKNIVNVVLTAEGYKVIDLGTNVSVEQFIEKAEEKNVDVIGLSTLMTTTMEKQRLVIEQLKAKGLRDKYIILVGGAPISQKWADKIGADAYCEDAFTTARYLNSLS